MGCVLRLTFHIEYLTYSSFDPPDGDTRLNETLTSFPAGSFPDSVSATALETLPMPPVLALDLLSVPVERRILEDLNTGRENERNCTQPQDGTQTPRARIHTGTVEVRISWRFIKGSAATGLLRALCTHTSPMGFFRQPASPLRPPSRSTSPSSRLQWIAARMSPTTPVFFECADRKTTGMHKHETLFPLPAALQAVEGQRSKAQNTEGGGELLEALSDEEGGEKGDDTTTEAWTKAESDFIGDFGRMRCLLRDFLDCPDGAAAAEDDGCGGCERLGPRVSQGVKRAALFGESLRSALAPLRCCWGGSDGSVSVMTTQRSCVWVPRVVVLDRPLFLLEGVALGGVGGGVGEGVGDGGVHPLLAGGEAEGGTSRRRGKKEGTFSSSGGAGGRSEASMILETVVGVLRQELLVDTPVDLGGDPVGPPSFVVVLCLQRPPDAFLSAFDVYFQVLSPSSDKQGETAYLCEDPMQAVVRDIERDSREVKGRWRGVMEEVSAFLEGAGKGSTKRSRDAVNAKMEGGPSIVWRMTGPDTRKELVSLFGMPYVMGEREEDQGHPQVSSRQARRGKGRRRWTADSQCIFLEGPSGSGKTTLLRALPSLFPDVTFLPLSSTEVVTAAVGASQENLRAAFLRAEAARRPVALLVDDVETLTGLEGEGQGGGGTMQRVLAELSRTLAGLLDAFVLSDSSGEGEREIGGHCEAKSEKGEEEEGEEWHNESEWAGRNTEAEKFDDTDERESGPFFFVCSSRAPLLSLPASLRTRISRRVVLSPPTGRRLRAGEEKGLKWETWEPVVALREVERALRGDGDGDPETGEEGEGEREGVMVDREQQLAQSAHGESEASGGKRKSEEIEGGVEELWGLLDECTLCDLVLLWQEGKIQQSRRSGLITEVLEGQDKATSQTGAQKAASNGNKNRLQMSANDVVNAAKEIGILDN
uniref:AAA+ ATPase domain-containing protein n=1 Tax=Chromera velia CCMP2878 TaxID=1169474 RepID=A0A0G4F6F5_9ALVE|eukprot:Cvel_15368.t1-p1 / transcript=Cvel_15368.t1 / gene=Cvel_15368 / organism=Chromera_velia_CCMP2878 / gene_product=hypothetical protein / transcript_product=hypothetical protein / location=Cvel_scaffold1133:2776-10088(+) / protein_length=933 / sequence_SO=supercontig / SO=protein_coding / is_pseudo=false